MTLSAADVDGAIEKGMGFMRQLLHGKVKPIVPVVIDIETFGPPPTEEEEEKFLSTFKPKNGAKHEDTIQRQRTEALAEWKQKRALYPGLNKIVCVGLWNLAQAGGEPVALAHENEQYVIQGTADYLNAIDGKIQFVGFNVRGFDLLSLAPAFARHNCQLKSKSKKWDVAELRDVFGNKGSLKVWADRFGVERSGLDGSSVHTLVKSGAYDAIANYCKDDVRITGELYKQLTTIFKF